MSSTTSRLTSAAALIAASVMMNHSAIADPSEALDRADISIGAYFVQPSIRLGLNTQYGSTDSGNISEHEITVPRVHGDFLIGDSQGISFDYYDFYKKYSGTLNRNFSVDASSVDVNATATANLGLDVGDVAYKWWLGHGSDVFGVGIGAAYYRIHLGANVSASSNVNASATSNPTYSADTFAPLLQLGWRHAFDHNVRMYVDASGVQKDGGKLNGHIYNATIGAEWYFLKNVGVGAEYSMTRVDIADNGDYANLNLKLDGPSVFLKARF